MPSALRTKDEVIDILLETFRQHGYDRGSLTELSRSTGLGKSSLYHHFPGGKIQMAEAVLDRLMVDFEVATRALSEADGSAGQRMGAILDFIDAFYEGGAKGCLLERMAASPDRDIFRIPLGAAFEAFIGALARVLRDNGTAPKVASRMAEDAVIRIQGALVVSAGLGDTGPFERTLAELRETLGQ